MISNSIICFKLIQDSLKPSLNSSTDKSNIFDLFVCAIFNTYLLEMYTAAFVKGFNELNYFWEVDFVWNFIMITFSIQFDLVICLS